MKKITQILCAVAFVFALASCQNSKAVSYQKDNGAGGYTEQKVNNNTYIISFDGNEHNKKNKTFDYALLRAAEIGQRNNFDYFAVLSTVNDKVLEKSNSYKKLDSNDTWLKVQYFKNNKPIKFQTVYEPDLVIKDLRKKYKIQ
ncbi:CC0125/CC1285 family lipoprotein [Empedobacter brevis]|uniref:CC0125/CC1285 family lipoprotein n=1 Tax=Empedobacter brevis TaxID=247 RepID=UPI0039AF5A83